MDTPISAVATVRCNQELNRILSTVPARDLASAGSDFAANLTEAGMSFEGRRYPVSMRPFVLPVGDAGTLTRTAETVIRVAGRIPAVVKRSAAVRRIFPAYADHLPLVRDDEECFLCRLDGVLDADGRFSVLELNTACPGGVIQSGMAARLWQQYGQKLFFDASEANQPIFTRDPHAFIRALAEAHRRGNPAGPQRARVVNHRGMYTNEVDHIVRGLRDIGVAADVAEAERVAVRDGLVYDLDDAGQPVDLVYNKLDPLALLRPELAGYLSAWCSGSAVFLNPLCAQWLLEDKASVAVLSDPALREELAVTAPESRLLDEVIPWTRVVAAGHTSGPDGDQVSLLDFARAAQDRLVVKPGNASRGDGVVLGYRVSPPEWERVLAEATRSPHVVQQRRPPMRFRVLPYGAAHPVEMFVGIDVFLVDGVQVGFHSRASTQDVMNVGKSGMLLPVYVTDGGV